MKNNGTSFEGTLENAKFQGNSSRTHNGQNLTTLCNSPLLGATQILIPSLTNGGGTTHWCVKNALGDNWELQPNGCGQNPAGHVFTYILTGNITCKYERVANITGTFTTTHPGTLVASNPVFTRHSDSSIFCPASGVLKNFQFRIYTDKATFAESTANPVAIS